MEEQYYKFVKPEDSQRSDTPVTMTVLCQKVEMFLRPIELPEPRGWVSLKYGKPTQEDANEHGWINVIVAGLGLRFSKWDDYPNAVTHFHPISKFVEEKLPPFGEWLMDQETTLGNAKWLTEKHAEYAALQKERE